MSGAGRCAKARILFVAEHALVRDLVSRALNGEPDLEVGAACASVPAALEILASRPVDLVLVDLDPQSADGMQLPARARAAGYAGPVLVITGGLSEAESIELVRRGVAGIFFRREPLEALLDCIRQLLRGGAWLDQRTLRALLRADPGGGGAESRLSERERDVLRAVCDGLATKEIAARLKLSESTVKAAVRRLFDQTGVRSRSQLVRVALERYRHLL